VIIEGENEEQAEGLAKDLLIEKICSNDINICEI